MLSQTPAERPVSRREGFSKGYMSNESIDTYKGPLDFFHFALAFFGLIIALTGVVITSVRVTLCGLVVLAWGFAYFYTRRD